MFLQKFHKLKARYGNIVKLNDCVVCLDECPECHVGGGINTS